MLPNHDMPLGRMVRSVRIDGYIVSEFTYPPNSTLPVHTHPFSNVSLVLSGVCEERTARTCHVGTPCSTVFKPGVPYSGFRQDARWTMIAETPTAENNATHMANRLHGAMTAQLCSTSDRRGDRIRLLKRRQDLRF